MKLFNVHNTHAHPGGMEVLFAALSTLLKKQGHDVVDIGRDNANLKSLAARLSAFGAAIHSPSVYREFSQLVQWHRPQLAHVHNLYPQFSTSALDAFHDNGVPVVMHVQDFKLTCPTAQHLRHGKICEKCLGGHEYWAAIHNCRNSLAMSTAYAVRNAWARSSGRVQRAVSLYLCPTQFVADLIIRGGYPADRVKVIPNFCDLPNVPPRQTAGDYIGYVGRISPEKGLDVLIEAGRRTGLPVKIAGDASLMPQLQHNLPANVSFVGKLSREELPNFLDGVRALVVPSVWYEAFGIVCVEALSRGIPVIASDIGGLGEVVDHEQTGLLVPAGDATALGVAMQRLWDDAAFARTLGDNGYRTARERYTPDAFYRQLSSLWTDVLAVPPMTRVPAFA